MNPVHDDIEMARSEAVKYAETLNGLKKAFATGKTRSYGWRVAQLQGVQRFMNENESKIAAALAADLGRHIFEAVGLEIVPVTMEITHILEHLKSWMKPTYTDVPAMMQPASSEIVSDPYGVCLIMGAFNYPISLTLGPLIGAICAGNCALIKPSEMSANTEKLLAEVLPSYLDKDCFAFVCGGVSTTTELLKLQFDKIFFTGSPRVGKIVMKAAAEHLTPVSLELGGKSPTIIDSSVTDMEVVAQRILWGKCANAGQTCIAPDYLFVHESKYEEFLQHAKKKLGKFYGSDIQRAPEFARIITTGHAERIQGLIQEAGPNAVAFGGKVDVSTRYVEPTLLVNVSLNSKVMNEEIFGPVLPIIKYSDINTVIAHINAHDKPLTMYIFAKNRKLIDRLTNSVSSGSVVVNDTLFQFANVHTPFGGVGASGMGGYHGKFSFDCFSHKRPIMRRDDHLILDAPQR